MEARAMELRCVTCGNNLISDNNFVLFKCPGCAETTVVRCGSCRVLKNPYKCEKCGFTGP